MMRIYFIFFLTMFGFEHVAQAADMTNPDGILTVLLGSLKLSSVAGIVPMAMTWLGAFASIQIVVTNMGMLKTGADIDAIIGKLIGSVVWFGFCIYVLNSGPTFIDKVGHQIIGQFPIGVGIAVVFTSVVSACSILLGIIAGVGLVNTSVGMVLSMILLGIFSSGMYLIIKMMMVTLELGLIVMLSPLSFAFLGLNALKDQGIAPFKSLISLVYRVILIGVISASFSTVFDALQITLQSFSIKNPLSWGDALQNIFGSLIAFPILTFLLFKSDSIAASLASGSTSMGASDVAGAVASGMAAGAAINGAAAKVVGKGGGPMSDVLSRLSGGGSIKNGGPGVGGQGGMPAGFGGGAMPSASLEAPVAPSSAAADKAVADQMKEAQKSFKAENSGYTYGGGNESAPSQGGQAAGNGGGTQAQGASGGGANSQGAAGAGSSNDLMGNGSSGAAPGASSSGSGAGGGKSGTGPVEGMTTPQGMQFTNKEPADLAGSGPQSSSGAAGGGSGANAGIAGAGGASASGLEKQLGDLVNAMSTPKDPSLKDLFKEANSHIAQEKAATHVSISAHHGE